MLVAVVETVTTWVVEKKESVLFRIFGWWLGDVQGVDDKGTDLKRPSLTEKN